MLLSFMILDPSKFSLFEYFTDKLHANKIVSYIDQLEVLDGNYSHEGINFNLGKIDTKLSYCVVYQNEDFDPELNNTLPTIAQNVMKGDKVSLRQLLQTKNLHELLFIQ